MNVEPGIYVDTESKVTLSKRSKSSFDKEARTKARLNATCSIFTIAGVMPARTWLLSSAKIKSPYCRLVKRVTTKLQ